MNIETKGSDASLKTTNGEFEDLYKIGLIEKQATAQILTTSWWDLAG